MMLKSFLILSHATLSSSFFARLPTKSVSVPLIGHEIRVGVSSLTTSESPQAPPDTLDELFLSIDKDGSGFIDLDELKSSLVALGQPSSDEHIRSLLSDANVESNALTFAPCESTCPCSRALLALAMSWITWSVRLVENADLGLTPEVL